MSDSENPRTLLAHLIWRFDLATEGVAMEALTYILNRYPASRAGFAALVERLIPDMRLSAQPFETEAIGPDGTRPDVLQRGDDGSERLFIEAKFYAPLTRNQPVRYLERLTNKGLSVLMFLAPAERVDELWPELLGRLADRDKPDSDEESRCVALVGTAKHLLITDWTKLLDNMEEQLKDSKPGLAELSQLRGLVEFAKPWRGKASLPGEELVNRVIEIGKTSRWLDTSGLRAVRGSTGYGRYANLGHRRAFCVWLGVNLDLFEEYRSTRLWVQCDNWSHADWNERVRPAPKDRMSLNIHEEGGVLWVSKGAELPLASRDVQHRVCLLATTKGRQPAPGGRPREAVPAAVRGSDRGPGPRHLERRRHASWRSANDALAAGANSPPPPGSIACHLR